MQNVNQGDAHVDAMRRVMKAITLRQIPLDIDKTIRRRAREKRISANKAVISLLEEHLMKDQHRQTELHHDLDDLCGAWTNAEAAAFDKTLVKQRAIDPDLWK
jgi:hypothetical protein